jgi:hypothetical protein
MYWFQAMSKASADSRPGTPSLLKSWDSGGMWWIERRREGAAAGRASWLSRGILNLGRSIVVGWCVEERKANSWVYLSPCRPARFEASNFFRSAYYQKADA